MYVAQPIQWTEQGVVMLDQRRLPAEEITHTYTDYVGVAKAIREMVIRGAPAIGVAAAMGVAIGVQKSTASSVDQLQKELVQICETLAKTRPTAVDLFWALERMKARFRAVTQCHFRSGGDSQKDDRGSAGGSSRKEGRRRSDWQIRRRIYAQRGPGNDAL